MKKPSSFAIIIAEHRLKPRIDTDGTTIVPGKLGQLYEYDEGWIGAMFIPANGLKGWNHRKEQWVLAGAEVVQNGDYEGAVKFPSNNGKLIRLSCKLLRIKNKRTMSPEQRELTIQRLAKARAQKGRDKFV